MCHTDVLASPAINGHYHSGPRQLLPVGGRAVLCVCFVHVLIWARSYGGCDLHRKQPMRSQNRHFGVPDVSGRGFSFRAVLFHVSWADRSRAAAACTTADAPWEVLPRDCPAHPPRPAVRFDRMNCQSPLCADCYVRCERRQHVCCLRVHGSSLSARMAGGSLEVLASRMAIVTSDVCVHLCVHVYLYAYGI